MVPATLLNPSATADVAPPSKLSEKHEFFVQALMSNGGRVGDAYAATYPNHGSTEAAFNHGCRLRARQDVQARIAELTRVSAAVAVIDAATLLRELHELATTSADEISRIVVEPCGQCWSDIEVARALDAAAAPGANLADFDAPRDGCTHCRSRGVQRVMHTPTDQLSGPARRLFAGARQKADGSIEVRIIDQLGARRELHELLGLKVSRTESKNLNINATLPVPADMSTDALLALWKESRSGA